MGSRNQLAGEPKALVRPHTSKAAPSKNAPAEAQESCYRKARLSMEFSGKTVDNLDGESLCIHCNPLHRASSATFRRDRCASPIRPLSTPIPPFGARFALNLSSLHWNSSPLESRGHR